ncbi:CU044_5270 family protein [Kutzneria kofuensis]|uniref:CU044_5270 family protein n=1 Tax=Kutzneria kofuensis TaxID=103725 RepID=A0A7W9NL90_9PSEU|nr:CU044_5270 family protein [Kutzneria kofuensis]MBB5897427.1 hypothetical protein [Kutzneria kofuensis]
MTADRLDEALDRLHQAQRTEEPDLGAIRARVLAAADRPPRRTRPVLWLAAAAALALLAASQVVPRPVAREPKISLASASAFLDAAADRQADEPIKPGQYRYVVTHSFDSVSQQLSATTGYSYLVEHRQQLWIPADPQQQWVMRREVPETTPMWLGGSIPQAQTSPPEPDRTAKGEWRADCGAFFPSANGKRPCEDPTDSESQAFYRNLPRDPQQLLAFLATHGSTPLARFRYATRVLVDGLMPADLRAAWYRAMAMIPGVRITADQATVDGRVGVAIGLADSEEHDDVIIDGSSGRFIGLRQLVGEHSQDFPWLAPGTLLESSAVTTTTVNGIG